MEVLETAAYLICGYQEVSLERFASILQAKGVSIHHRIQRSCDTVNRYFIFTFYSKYCYDAMKKIKLVLSSKLV